MSKITRIARGALLVALAVGLAGSARALTLADLNAGASFSSPDGSLLYSDFHVTLPATVGSATNALAGVNLAIFEVQALPSSGFDLHVLQFNIPLVAAGDQVGQMLLDFKVTSVPTTLMDGVGLRFTGTAIGAGAVTRIDDLVQTPAGSVSLHAIRQAGGTQDPDDNKALPGDTRLMDVAQTITLDVHTRSAFIAQLSEAEFNISARPVPEPGAFAIFSGSMMLVTAASRRRWL